MPQIQLTAPAGALTDAGRATIRAALGSGGGERRVASPTAVATLPRVTFRASLIASTRSGVRTPVPRRSRMESTPPAAPRNMKRFLAAIVSITETETETTGGDRADVDCVGACR